MEALKGLEAVAEAELREVPSVRGGGLLASGIVLREAAGQAVAVARVRVAKRRADPLDAPEMPF